jgi:hypothetical protein
MWSSAADRGRSTGRTRRSGTAKGSAAHVTTAPFELVLAASFVSLLILCAGFGSMPGMRHDGLALLCAFVAVTCWWATPSAAVAVGTLAWPFYLGWVVRDDGQLTLRGWTEPVVLAVFIGVALLVVTLRRAFAWSIWNRAVRTGVMAGAGAEVADTAALFYGFPRRSPQASDLAADQNGTRSAEDANQA